MSRDFFRAYLQAQAAHKELHRLLRDCENDMPHEALIERLRRLREQLNEIEILFHKSR